jgi:hypothetical protein
MMGQELYELVYLGLQLLRFILVGYWEMLLLGMEDMFKFLLEFVVDLDFCDFLYFME